jgi:Tol biopolymer transport system component
MQQLGAAPKNLDPVVGTALTAVDPGLPQSIASHSNSVLNPNGTRNLEVYVMNPDGTDQTRLTFDARTDQQPDISPNGLQIVFCSTRITDTNPEGDLEIFVMDADGSNVKQITNLGKANWAPNFMPDGKRIIFASNHEYERGFPFNMYTINMDGTGLTKISHDGGFAAFPMFSPDGKKLIFSSNRNNGGTRDTNLFICDWVE